MRALQRGPEPEPETTAPDCGPDQRPAAKIPISAKSSAPQRLVGRRRSRERLHLLYVYDEPEPEPARQARELLSQALQFDPAASAHGYQRGILRGSIVNTERRKACSACDRPAVAWDHPEAQRAPTSLVT